METDDPREDPASAPYLIAFASLGAAVGTFLFVSLGQTTETEERNRYIQSLERSIAERDAQIRDLEIALDRREMRFALANVRGMMRVNLLLGRVPSRLVRRLLRARRVAAGAEPPSPRTTTGPLFSIVLPVYGNLEFLKPAIESALGQTFRDLECVIYDDASPDAHYGSQRYDKGELERTLIRFHEKHSLSLRLGGFDEVGLPISLSDVDFCLRARQQGFRIVYTPFAEFLHEETATRDPELDPREVRLMGRRRGHVLARDPYYHPGLTLCSDTARPDPWRRAGAQAARAH